MSSFAPLRFCKLGLISKCHGFSWIYPPPPHPGCNSGKWSFSLGFCLSWCWLTSWVWGRQIPVILHPGQTNGWNLKNTYLKWNIIFQTLILGFKKMLISQGFFPMHVTNHHLRYLRLRAVWTYWRRHLPIHPTQPGCENCRHQEKWHETCFF